MRKNIFLLTLTILFIFSLIQGCKKEENPVTPPSEHFEPVGWIFSDVNQNPILVVWEGEIQPAWNGTTLQNSFAVIANSTSGNFFISFLDEDGNNLDPDDDGDYTIGFVISDTSVVDVIKATSSEWVFQLSGKTAGSANMEVQLLHGGHVDVRTPQIPVVVQ